MASSDTRNSFARAVALTGRPRSSRLSISFLLIAPDGPCTNKKLPCTITKHNRYESLLLGSFSASPPGPTRCVELGRLGMRCWYLRRSRVASAHFPKIGISCFADMTELDAPAIEIRDDNQVSAHCGNDGPKLIDMDVSVPSLEL